MMSHRKFRRLVALTRLPEAHVRGLLECLWDAAYETGDPFVGDSTDVEAAARWNGHQGDFTAALLQAGGDGQAGYIEALDGVPGRYSIHDLHDHAPEYVKNRWRREQERRSTGSRFRENRTVTDRSLMDQRQISDDSVSVTPVALQSVALQVREEQKNYVGDAASPGEGQVLLVFPCRRGTKSGPEEWCLLAEFVAEVEATYPEMDVVAESRKALLWLKANELKTYSGMARFLTGWFSRANNSRQFIAKSKTLPFAPPAKDRPIGQLDRSGKFRWDGEDWEPVEPVAPLAPATPVLA